MDEKKLKLAFQKIKKDITKISDDITSLKIEIARNEINKNANKDSLNPKCQNIDKKLNNFVNNVEEEFKKINFNLKEIEDRSIHNSKKLDQIEFQYNKLKKNDEKNHAEIEKNYLNVTSIEERFLEFTELINEKINLEMSSLRLEFTDEIAKIYDEIYANEEVKRNINLKKNKTNSELVEEPKKSKKTKSSKKTRDKKNKTKNKKKENKEETIRENKIEQVIYEEDEEPKKEGKMKKILKWLFIDEEDDYEIQNVKKEIKNKKSSKKNK